MRTEPQPRHLHARHGRHAGTHGGTNHDDAATDAVACTLRGARMGLVVAVLDDVRRRHAFAHARCEDAQQRRRRPVSCARRGGLMHGAGLPRALRRGHMGLMELM